MAQGSGRTAEVEHELADVGGRCALCVVHFQGEVERLVVFVNRCHGLSGEQHAHSLGKLGERDAVACEEFALGRDLQLRPLYLLLHVEVGHTLDAADFLLDVVAEGIHLAQIVAEHLDSDVGLRTGEHGVDTVRNRCAHLDRDARHGGEFLSYLGEHFFLVASGQFEGGFYFRRVHAERVLIEFRASRFAPHGLYFRHGEQ